MHHRTTISKTIARRGWIPLFLALCLQAAGFPLFAASARAYSSEFGGKRVLLLHSYHHSFSHTRTMTRAIEALLEPTGINLYLEYLDTKRHFSASHMYRLTRAMAYRYAAIPMDAIIATDDNALDFLLDNRDSLFPGVPVVFCGANNFDPDRLTGKTGYTGVNEALSIRETLDAALGLQPDAREVVVISDVTETGRQNLDRLKALAPSYAERVRFRYLVGPPRAEMRKILAGVRRNDVVLYLSYFRTEADENLSIPESMRFISGNSPAPVYALWDFTLGHGTVGGKMVSSEAQGIAAAQLALQVISGVSADALPVVMESPNRYIFDHAQLRRFGISVRDLPEGSRVVNRTVPPLVRYLPWVIGALVVICLETLLIGNLLLQRRRLQRTQAELRENRARYRALFEEAPDAIYLNDLEGRFLDGNAEAERLLGYSRDELVGQNFLEAGILPEDQLEIALGLLERNQRGEATGPDELVLRNRAGDRVQLEVKTHVLQESSGPVVLGIVRDVTEKRRARQRLEESERHLKEAQRIGQVGSWTQDYRTGRLSWSEEIYALTSVDPALPSPDAKAFLERVHPDDRSALQAIWKEFREGARDAGEIEYRIFRPGGKVRYLIERGELERDENGAPLRITGTLQDITDRKVAEEKIEARLEMLTAPGPLPPDLSLREVVDAETMRRLTARLRELLGIAFTILDFRDEPPSQVGWRDICTDFHRADPLARRFCEASNRWAVRESAEKGWVDYVCPHGLRDLALPIRVGDRTVGALLMGQFFYEDEPPDRKRFLAQAEKYGFDPEEYLAALDRVPRYSREYIDGVMKFLESFVAVIASLGGKNLTQARAIGERERAEEALRAANQNLERLATAIDQAAEVILITDPQGHIQYVNPAFEQVTGYPAEEVAGRHPGFLLGTGAEADGGQTPWPEIWQTVSAGRTWSGRISGRHRDGRTLQEETVISPVRDGDGEIINLVAVMRDITAEIALEAQLRQAQKMEAVGQLAGGVAHDFNNLLQVVSGYAEIALSEIGEGHAVAPFLSEVLKAAGRAQNLVRQLLVFSRREASHPRSLNLNEVVEGMMKMIGRVLGEHIDLTFAPDPELPAVEADPHLMEQVLMNLCVNARDAMGDGGALCIRTQTRHLSEAEPFSSDPWFRPGPFAVLSVSDTGCGIALEVRERIFEPFFSTKEVGKGTGLGLATVYGIVKQHEGFIQVGDQEEGGTRFDIFLPAGDGAPDIPSEAPDEKTARTGGGETILLAEDDEMVRRLATRILERAGYRVLKAKDGEEALETFRAEARRIDLAILDVVMPRRSGRAVYDEIHAVRPELPILFASGYSYNMLEAGGVHPEAFEVLPKPFRSEELLERVHRLLEGAPARRPERPAPA